MTKIKINPGLAAIILLATLFAGWESLLLVTLLMFIFCDVDESIKNVATRVITFYVGFAIVSLGWNLISSGVDFIVTALNNLVGIINTYLEPEDYIVLTKITNPVNNVMEILNSGVAFLLLFARLAFILAVLTGKKSNGNVVSNKINEYVAKAINFVNAFGAKQAK